MSHVIAPIAFIYKFGCLLPIIVIIFVYIGF